MVENQTSFTLQSAEMHVFETHQHAEGVLLEFSQPVLATMLEGKKIMHLEEMDAFDFLPGESLILPSHEVMCIDFPEAERDNPTRCLAMAISEEKIRNVVCFLNENMPKTDEREWTFTDYNFHFTNDIAIHQIIHRLIFIFTENHPSKDLFADFLLQELVIRLLQTENRRLYTDQARLATGDNRMAFAVQYIRENLSEALSIDELASRAHMSKSNFHRVFKNEMGLSPVEFINHERIRRAASLLHDADRMIKEVGYACGFNNLSYFVRQFKKATSMSPKAYQDRIRQARTVN